MSKVTPLFKTGDFTYHVIDGKRVYGVISSRIKAGEYYMYLVDDGTEPISEHELKVSNDKKMIQRHANAQKAKVNELDKGGRPAKYKKEMCAQVLKLCILGSTDQQIADFLEISESTFNEWKKKYPELSESIKNGKEIADSNVAVSLYKRAVGYTHPEEKIFMHEGKPVRVQTTKHYAPDATSAIFFLKNRQPKLWRDTKVLQGDAEAPIPVIWNEQKTYESPKEIDSKED